MLPTTCPKVVQGYWRHCVFWTGSLGDCHLFTEMLNNNDLNFCLTSHYFSSVDFLYLKLTSVGGSIQTTLYCKKTATNSLLHFSSFHLLQISQVTPICQFLKVRHNWSEFAEFKTEVRDLSSRFKARGYPDKIVSKAFERARHTLRVDLLKPKIKFTLPQTNMVPIITNYNNEWGGSEGHSTEKLAYFEEWYPCSQNCVGCTQSPCMTRVQSTWSINTKSLYKNGDKDACWEKTEGHIPLWQMLYLPTCEKHELIS